MQKEQIPKVIHYCWFGGTELPESVKKYMKSWRQFCPEYKFKLWNEDNFDVNSVKFVKEAYIAKKYAFVADYVRMYALYEEGGIYLETDTELLKPINELLDCNAFIGRGSKTVTLPLFGMIKGHSLAQKVLEYYGVRGFIRNDGTYDMTTINQIVYRVLIQDFGYQETDSIAMIRGGIRVYPRNYFFTDWSSGVMKISKESYVIHYSDASWQSDEQRIRKQLFRKYAKYFGMTFGKKIADVVYYFRYRGIKCTVERIIQELRIRVGSKVLKISFPLQKKIVFDNFHGRGYGCNPKYIAEEIIKRKLPYKLVWAIDGKQYDLPSEIRRVKIGTLRYYYELATSKIWIDNVRKGEEIKKRKEQYYIQTWHGFIPFKKMERDAEATRKKEDIQRSIHDSEMADLFMSGCKLRTKLYTDGTFYYSGEVLECGTPRNDGLVSHTLSIEKVYKKYGIQRQKKIVLYAPTFRNNKSMMPYSINAEQVLINLNGKFKEDYVFLLRLHPSMRDMSAQLDFGQNVIDASNYEDVQELLASADVLISDYSDCMFEAALSGAKVFIFATDMNEYMHERDFYLKLTDLPFSISQTNEELKEAILNFNVDEYKKNLQVFFDKVGVVENGNASQKVVDIIEKIMNR